MFLSHGGRPTKGNGRKRKGVDEYAAENRVDFTSRSIIRDGQLVRILVCRFCCQSIGARSDRIKEHLASKRHQKLKLEAFREAAEAGRDLTQEYSDDSVSGLLPEPPITMLKFPGKALAHLLEGDGGGRHGTREMTPESDTREPNIQPVNPVKSERMQSSPPPQTHGLLGGFQSSGVPLGLVGGGRLNSNGNLAATPPPQLQQQQLHHQQTHRDHQQQQQQSGGSGSEKSPQQLLCVRWGNFDSNIVSMFTKLRSAEHFVDATLWCEGKTIKCHKMILSACSTYFEKLLTENPNPHPIIFLKDMRYWEITALVEFMYRGEVSIHQEKLQSLLRAAESLQIKGLGSPSAADAHGGGGGGGGGAGSEETLPIDDDDDLSNGATMDMSTASHNSHTSNSSHNTTNMLQQHLNSSSPLSNHLLNSGGGGQSLLNSMNMGIDLSAHGALGGLSHLQNSPLALSLSLNNNNNNNSLVLNNNKHSSSSMLSQAAKRRKKETPRRIDIPRAALPLPIFNSTMASVEGEEDDVPSDDSMAALERNHLQNYNSESRPEVGYDEEDEGQENYADHEQGSQIEEEGSGSEGGGDQEDEMGGGPPPPSDLGDQEEERDDSGALSLRVTSAAERDRLERERSSRKGNPIKKIQLGNNNNNNNNNLEGTSIVAGLADNPTE